MQLHDKTQIGKSQASSGSFLRPVVSSNSDRSQRNGSMGDGRWEEEGKKV